MILIGKKNIFFTRIKNSMKAIQYIKFFFLIVILSVLCINPYYSCVYQENMQTLSPMVYISNPRMKILNQLYNYNNCKTKYTNVVWHVPDNDANVSTLVLPSQSLHFYSETESRPECCGPNCGIKTKYKHKNQISKTSGCLCMSNEQIEYIRNRGGNSIKTYDNTIF